LQIYTAFAKNRFCTAEMLNTLFTLTNEHEIDHKDEINAQVDAYGAIAAHVNTPIDILHTLRQFAAEDIPDETNDASDNFLHWRQEAIILNLPTNPSAAQTTSELNAFLPTS
jgi:hypothetical protein